MSVTYPLPNATVLIIRSDRTYAVVTKTDENGKVTITVPPGTYDIYVIKNYFTIHHQVEVVNQDVVKTIKLEKLYTKEYISQYIAQLLGTVEGIYSTLQTIEYNYPEILKPWCIDALIREPEYGEQLVTWWLQNYPEILAQLQPGLYIYGVFWYGAPGLSWITVAITPLFDTDEILNTVAESKCGDKYEINAKYLGLSIS